MAQAATAQRAHRFIFGPAAYGVAVLLLRVALGLAFLAAAYLLFGLLSGQLAVFAGLPAAERARIQGNIAFAANALTAGATVAALAVALVYLAEDTTGYLMVFAGLLVQVGIPYLLSLTTSLGAYASNPAMQRAVAAFPQAAWGLYGVGGVLILRDVALRLGGVLKPRKLDRDTLQFGGAATPEKTAKPVRLSLLGKCWEGPFCRDFVRVHCPIFHARKACWRVRRGCYCEDEIVATAARRMSNLQNLTMAPDPRYNFANDPTTGRRQAELSPFQKRERCRHCVIYNQHQKDKYALLMPLVLIGVPVLCLMFSPQLRGLLQQGLAGVEVLMSRFSFGDSQAFSWRMGRPSPTVEWILVAGIIVMLVSKALQLLEWAVFKIKI